MVPVIDNLGTVTFIWVLNNHAKMPNLVTGTGVGLSHFCPCVDGVSRKLYSTPVARGVTFF